MSVILQVIGPLLKYVLEALWGIREKSREAVEISTDPVADAKFWEYERL